MPRWLRACSKAACAAWWPLAYSLYVSGAQEFLPAFYRRLFKAGSVAEAVRAGRQEMLTHKGRVCARGRYALEDWLLPVLYQQESLDFGFVKNAAWTGGGRAEASTQQEASRLPPHVREHREEYGFVGRDGSILEIERALHRPTPSILVQGLGGVGKTTLARGRSTLAGGIPGSSRPGFRDQGTEIRNRKIHT